jgi:hypothetical protein
MMIITTTVVLLRCHAAEDAGITIFRKVGSYLTLDEALPSQHTCTVNIRLFIYCLKWQLTYGLQKCGKVLEYKGGYEKAFYCMKLEVIKMTFQTLLNM